MARLHLAFTSAVVLVLVGAPVALADDLGDLDHGYNAGGGPGCGASGCSPHSVLDWIVLGLLIAVVAPTLIAALFVSVRQRLK